MKFLEIIVLSSFYFLIFVLQLLNGNEWYQLEAIRAVNQAVGRVIRHAEDHGAIIFCDCRFSFPSNIKTLSTWLQTHIIPNATFGQGLKHISNFFKSWKDTPVNTTSHLSSQIGNNDNINNWITCFRRKFITTTRPNRSHLVIRKLFRRLHKKWVFQVQYPVHRR